MAKKSLSFFSLVLFLFILTPFIFASEKPVISSNLEIAGVEFPNERIVEGKTLKLNGVSILKKYGFVQVYAVGLYLEKATQDPQEIINSEQIKCMYTQYLTNKATKEKIQNGFIELISECNTTDLVNDNKVNINRFASWLDSDMKPGLTSETIYIPGNGLTLIYQNQVKGTIPGKIFAQMYYRYSVGENANDNVRSGLLGLKNK